MEVVKGHPCRNCESQVNEFIREGSWGLRRYELYRCFHCGTVFKVWIGKAAPGPKPDTNPSEPDRREVVTYVPSRTLCPECGGPAPVMRTLSRTRRQHKCTECGHCFKSIDRDAPRDLDE